MLPKAQACRLSLISTLVLYTSFCALVLADTIRVDDQDQSLSVQWHGSWTQSIWVEVSEDAGSFDGTLTSTNQSGATATFTFTGISVQVLGALQPIGTWDMRSQYFINDTERLTMFSPPQPVNQRAFRQQFYDSGTLPAGNHTLTVINMGEQLWLDYFQYDDGTDAIPAPAPKSRTTVTKTSITQTSSATRSSSSTSTEVNHRSSTPSTPSTSSQSSTSISISITNFTLPPASAAANLPLSPSSTASSSNAPTPSQVAEIPPSHAHGMSHGALVGLTAATIVGAALLATLLWLARRYNRRTRSRLRASRSSAYTPIIWDSSHGDPFRARDRDSGSQCSTTLSMGTGTPGSVTYPTTAWRGDVAHSRSSCWRQKTAISRRSVDGGVTIAGGPGVSHADAPSVSDAASEKSTLPPSYQTHDAPCT